LTRPALAVVALAAVLAAGCLDDHTTEFPDQPPTTATTSTSPTTLAAANCPTILVGCPRPDVTPGAVIPSTDGVCTRQYNARGRLSAADKRKLLAAYDLPPGTKPAEIDHLVPRWAGGTSDLANLWPQVDPAERDRKDALEEQLYLAVCHSASLTLAEARDRAAHFWAWWPPPDETTTTRKGTP